jgi:hypothetical protein
MGGICEVDVDLWAILILENILSWNVLVRGLMDLLSLQYEILRILLEVVGSV